MTTETATPPAAEPFASADADTLAGLSATFRALAVTLAAQINALAADFDALAAARGGDGVPLRLPEQPPRRSVGDLIALPDVPPAPPVEPTPPAPRKKAVPPPLDLRPEAVARREAEHADLLAEAEAALVRPLAAGDDILAHIRELADVIRRAPRTSFNSTLPRRGELQEVDQVGRLHSALRLRAARLAVTARRAGVEVAKVLAALGHNSPHVWPSIEDTAEGRLGAVERDAELGMFIRAAREAADA